MGAPDMKAVYRVMASVEDRCAMLLTRCEVITDRGLFKAHLENLRHEAQEAAAAINRMLEVINGL